MNSATLLLALSGLLSPLAQAPSADAETPTQNPQASPAETHHHPENGVSARILSGRTWLDRSDAPLLGAGLAYERDFFDGLFAIEAAGEWLYEPNRNALLLELLVEHAFPVTPLSHLYVGGGPVVAAALEPGHGPSNPRGALGGLMMVGFDVEIVPRWELFVELDTALLMAEAPVLETDIGTGVMWRF